MAIDPSISLSYRSPVITPPLSPVEQYGQILSLRNLMTQGQAGQLGLQEKQLQLEQMQMDRDNQRRLMEYLGTAQAAPGAPGMPAAPSGAPAAPSLMPTPPSGTPAQTAPAQPPAQLMPGLVTPTAPLSSLMPTRAAAPAAPAAAPAAAPSATGGQSGLDFGYILRNFGAPGMAFTQKFNEAHKTLVENEIKQADLTAKNAARDQGLAIAIRDSKNPQQQFLAGITQMEAEGRIPHDQAQQWRADGYDAHKDDVQAFIDRAQTAIDSANVHKTDMETLKAQQEIAHNKIMNPAAETEAGDKAAAAEAQRMYRDAQLLSDPQQLPDFIAKQRKEVQPYLTKLSALPLDQFKAYLGQAATAAKPGETFATAPAVIASQVGAKLAEKQGELAMQAELYAPTIRSVLSGDTKYQDLPAEVQTKIAPYLVQGNYTGFGKQISDAERQRIDDLNNAVNLLERTQANIKDPYNRTFMGPPSGVMSHVPVVGSNIKKMQSDLALTQQKLKAFTANKSLRGLTTDTLDQIFPTVTNTPDVNDYKIQNLLNTVKDERDQFVKDLAGKVIPPGLPGAGKPAASTAAGAAAPHIGKIGDKYYQYTGSGATDDMANYVEVPAPR